MLLGHTDIVKILVEHGADPNAKDNVDNTPLHLAADNSNSIRLFYE